MAKSHFEQICEQTKKLVIYGKLQEATDLVYDQLLREYQKEGIATIDQYVNSGTNRVLRQAFTGTGKSVEQLYLAMRHIAQSKDNKVLFFVPTEELIQNLADYFRSNGIHTGFIKAGVPMTNRVQVYIASVATLVKRLDALPFTPTLILADECHHAPSNTWSKSFSAFDCPKIGFSATPERLDGKGFDKLFDTIVYGNSYRWYIDNGYLAPWEVKVPENQAEAMFSVTKGDYDQKEQEDFLKENKVYGNAVTVWDKHCKGLKTIVFAPTIDSSKEVVEEYNQYGMLYYGRAIAAHLDGKTPDRERKDVFKRFKLPLEHPDSLLIMSNVALFIEGISVPSCHVTQWLRKTKSSIIFDQGNGRSNRYEPGKIQYIIDHVGNLKEHGTPDRERTYHLTGRKKRQQTGKYALVCLQDGCNHFLTKDFRKLDKKTLKRGWVPCPECKKPVYIPKAQPGDESKQTRRGAEIEEDHEFVTIRSDDADLRILNLNALFRRFDKVKSAPKFYRELMKYPNLTLDDFKLACRYRGRSEYEANGIWPEYCAKQIPQVNF